MNHQLFENWLLDDKPLSVPQKRELEIHVRDCTSCAAIAESNLSLHVTHATGPAPGFTDRFRFRLAVWRREQRRRQILGTIVLVLGGLAGLYAIAGPMIVEAARSPANWLTAVAAFLVVFTSFISVLGEVGGILVRGFVGFVPPAAWFAMIISGCGIGVLWMVMMRRLARASQGV